MSAFVLIVFSREFCFTAQHVHLVFRHEGFGSPFALLKARGWATGLSAGEGGSSFSARSFFTVGITLTDEGG